ncbi:MAG: tetratricopeptide repeat protein [Burkholderiales bacterium]|nr:tetratricopeptide repeat protein [Burkholderiales bacterium]
MPRPDTPLNQRLDTAVAHYRAGDLAQAEALCALALADQPDHARALHLAGVIAKQNGQMQAACDFLARANQAEAHNPFILRDLAEAMRLAGRPEQALSLLEQAIHRAPELPDLFSALGLTCEALGQIDAAIRAHSRTVELLPQHAGAQNILGSAYRKAGDLVEAKRHFEAALALDPRLADALYNLGNIALETGQYEAAIAAYSRYVEVDPNNAQGWNNLAAACLKNRAYARAIACFDTAVRIQPTHPAALNLAITLTHLGRHEDALAAFERCREAQASNPNYWRYYAMALLYLPDTDAALRSVLHELDQRFAAPIYAQATKPSTKPLAGRKLRIGYVSSDFREHPVARNLLPVLQQHDRARFELYLYANISAPDAMSERLMAASDQFRLISQLNDTQAAAQIREDEIDVLVILAWRFDVNRPLIAAHRAAPVCVNFHDPGTTGMSGFDYVIADSILVPKRGPAPKRGTRWFSERVVRLPSYYLHQTISDTPPIQELPALQNGYLTFASFNNPAKLNPAVIALWSQLLNVLPASRLILKYKDLFADAYVRENIAVQFARHGIHADRLTLDSADESAADHLSRYHAVDISLDPFPFNGSTTSFESLWMGVPVLTLAGEAMVSRWGATILTRVGLREWITDSESSFLQTAQTLATDLPRLAALRRSLRSQVEASSLCDAPRYTRHWERLLRCLCDGKNITRQKH